MLRKLYLKWFKNTKIWHYTNIFKTATIGKNCNIGSYVEIGDGVIVGNDCKIQTGVFIPKGVTIGDDVFIGPYVTIINDKYPKARGEWSVLPTRINNGASVGAGSTILCGIIIGENAKIGAGSVVTKDVKAGSVVYGNPAIVRESKW